GAGRSVAGRVPLRAEHGLAGRAGLRADARRRRGRSRLRPLPPARDRIANDELARALAVELLPRVAPHHAVAGDLGLLVGLDDPARESDRDARAVPVLLLLRRLSLGVVQDNAEDLFAALARARDGDRPEPGRRRYLRDVVERCTHHRLVLLVERHGLHVDVR